MRIGINSLQVRGAKSGVGQYIYCLLGEMIPLDPDIEFINYLSVHNLQNYDFSFSNYKATVWGSRHRSKTIRLLYEYAFLPHQIRHDALDLFHAPSNLLPLRKVCPYVVTIHDMSYFVDPRRYTRSKALYWQTITRRTIKLADCIITDSEYSKQDILRYFSFPEDRIIVIPIAAHSLFRPLGDDLLLESFLHKYKLKNKAYILNVGTLEPGKNQSRLIRAFHLLRQRLRKDISLVIVGDKGWLYEPVFQTVEKLGLRDHVIFTGHVSDDDLVSLYNTALMLVFPALNEGFGLPVLEAMACGLPVIASSTTAIPEIAGDAALLVDPQDTDAIADAMRSVLTNVALRDSLIRKGLQRAKKFTWRKTAQKTLEVYRSVLEHDSA